jgi:CBS domain-containing protein
MRKMKILKLMEKPVLRINADASVQEAGEIMGKNHVGALLVTRGQASIGIITERDIMSQVIAQQRKLNEVNVTEVMSTPLITVEKNTTAEDAIKLMTEKGVRRLLITDNETILGVFSTSDITKLA